MKIREVIVLLLLSFYCCELCFKRRWPLFAQLFVITADRVDRMLSFFCIIPSPSLAFKSEYCHWYVSTIFALFSPGDLNCYSGLISQSNEKYFS